MSSQIDSSPRERQGRALRNRNKPRKKIPVRPPLQSAAEGAAKRSPAEVPAPKRRFPWLLCFLILIQAALLAAFVWLVRLPKPEMPVDPDRQVKTVRWQVTGQEDRVETVYYGEPVTLPESVDAEGYTFLGWLDADGRLEEHRSIPVYRDMAQFARCSVAAGDRFPVQQHESVFHLEPTESDPLVNPFANGTVRCHDFNLQIIQIRDLRTPLPRADYRHGC